MSSPEAVLSLLDDPDPEVTSALVTQLHDNPELLDQVWDLANHSDHHPLALIHAALSTETEALVARFGNCTDLEQGVWVLPTLHRPRTPWHDGRLALDQLAERVPATADPAHIARWLGNDLGFCGDRMDYYQPENSYLPLVLQRRAGLPIALTALWMLLCRRLGHPVHAVALPGHVLGRWAGGYLDPFAAGRPVDGPTIEAMCLASGVVDPTPYLDPASERNLLARMARNLVYAYRLRNDLQRAAIANAMAEAIS